MIFEAFNIKGKYDIVFCTGTLPIFKEIEIPIRQLLAATKTGGYVFCDGLFNKFDVDVVITYRDNSNTHTKDKWRCDFNQHSRKRIAAFLDELKVNKFDFFDIDMNLDIAFNSSRHGLQFTFRDAKGTNLLTNGMNIILNKTMLIIHN